MRTRRRPFAELTGFLGVAALAVVFASRASSSTAALEPEFRATYPRTPVVAGVLAGVRVDDLVLPGLRLIAREDHSADEGGVILSYGDSAARVVIELAVTPDAPAARRFVEARLHAIARAIPAATDPAFGDYAFGDGDSLVIGAAQNVAWVVRVLTGSSPRAREVVAELRAKCVAGAPVFPTASLALPSVIPLAGFELRVSSSAKVKLRAEGAYVAHGKSAPILKPFRAGPVVAIATAVDELARVSETRATAEAKPSR